MMRLLTDQQEELVLLYIRLHGVSEPTLEADLHDHLCCLIEEQVVEGTSFCVAYGVVIGQYSPEHLLYLQQQQTLLLTQPSELMKKLFYAVLFLTILFINTGSLFKWMHWPGAGAIMSTGFCLLLFLLLPTVAYMMLRNSKHNATLVNVRIVSGLFFGALMASGWLFKLMHWTGANLMFMVGMIGLNLVFLPLFMYQLYQKSRLTYGQ